MQSVFVRIGKFFFRNRLVFFLITQFSICYFQNIYLVLVVFVMFNCIEYFNWGNYFKNYVLLLQIFITELMKKIRSKIPHYLFKGLNFFAHAFKEKFSPFSKLFLLNYFE